jgi:hypothetical protein
MLFGGVYDFLRQPRGERKDSHNAEAITGSSDLSL